MIKYNSRDLKYKKPYGAVPENMKIDLNVYISRELGMCKLFLQIIKDGGKEEWKYPMSVSGIENGEDIYSVSFSVENEGLYWYRFFYYYEDNAVYIGRNEENIPVIGSENSWQLTVYKEDYKTPDWIKGGVMYQIFPDRFCRSSVYKPVLKKGKKIREDWGGIPKYIENKNGNVLNNEFFGGNLHGIIEKLDYLKSLGVNCIYLNPIFESDSNHKYDTGDYEKIDEMFGDEEIFKLLCEEAEKREIGIILDGVFSHTGSDSRYFNKYGNYNEIGAYQSKASPFYQWYSFINWPDSYKSWWGVGILPEVKEEEPSYLNYITGEEGVLAKWLNAGAKGYRLDVADELPDLFLDELRNRVKFSKKDALIIGEVWEDASNKVSYGNRRRYLRGNQLDSVMNYVFRNAIIDFVINGNGKKFVETIESVLENYPQESVDCLMNILGTHDTARILTETGDIQKLKNAVAIQYFLPGVPCIYYGDEAGMEGKSDPFCRECFPWGNENSEILEYYKVLGNIRLNNKDILKSGKCFTICIKQDMIGYIRTNGKKSLFVIVNSSTESETLKLNQMGFTTDKKMQFFDLINEKYSEDEIIIEGNSNRIFILEWEETNEKQSNNFSISINNGICNDRM